MASASTYSSQDHRVEPIQKKDTVPRKKHSPSESVILPQRRIVHTFIETMKPRAQSAPSYSCSQGILSQDSYMRALPTRVLQSVSVLPTRCYATQSVILEPGLRDGDDVSAYICKPWASKVGLGLCKDESFAW